MSKIEEAQYKRLVETMSEGVGILDHRGQLTYVNPRLCQMLGYPPEELCGRPVAEFFDEENRRILRAQLEQRHAGVSSSYEITWITASGQPLPTRVAPQALTDEQGNFLGSHAVVTDISALKLATETLKIQRDIAVILSASTSIEQILSEFSACILRIEAVTGCGVYLADLDTGGLVLATHRGLPEAFVAQVRHFQPDTPQARLVQRGDPLFGHYPEIHRQQRFQTESSGLRAFAMIPVRYEGRSVAALNLISRTHDEFDEDLCAQLQSYAVQLGAVISRVKAEEATRRSEVRYRLIVDNIMDVIWTMDMNQRFTYVSPSVLTLRGFSVEEALNQTVADIVPSSSIPRVTEFMKRELAAGLEDTSGNPRQAALEVEMLRKDGSTVWTQTRTTLLMDGQGAPAGVVGVSRDISDRWLAEQRFKTAAHLVADLIYEWNVGDDSLVWFGKIDEILGFAPGEFPHTIAAWAGQIHPEDRARLSNAVELHRTSTVPIREEYRISRKDGTLLYWEDRGEPVLDSEGRPYRWIGVCTDVTERKRAEQALMESEEIFRALAENAYDTIMRFDRQGRHLYVNPVVEQQTGIPAADFLGKTHAELGFPPHLTKMWDEAIHRVFSSGQAQRLEFMLPKDIWIDWLVVPEFGDSGEVKAVLTSARDITERKRSEQERAKLETQLQQSQKMEAVGRLAGGIAHDFNNILTGINGYAELLLSSLSSNEPMRADVEEILKAGERAASLTNQLLAFSRKQVISPQVIDPNEVIARSQKMLQRIIGEDIEMRFLPGEDLGSILADPNQLDQILINLVINAKDAMPEGGKLTIETLKVILEEEHHPLSDEALFGECVMVAISDCGHGMSRETIEHIFEPFFSTKPKDRGTGLGLATVYGIVQQNKGLIKVYSELEHGTTFKIYFPVTHDTSNTLARELISSHLQGHETILLVEDEEMVRRLARKILDQHGYTVLEASNGQEACLLGDAKEQQIDLLLTDVILPSINGKELFIRLRQARPDLKALFMSGYTENVIAHHGVLEQGTNFLAKPFTIEGLVRMVRMVLDV